MGCIYPEKIIALVRLTRRKFHNSLRHSELFRFPNCKIQCISLLIHVSIRHDFSFKPASTWMTNINNLFKSDKFWFLWFQNSFFELQFCFSWLQISNTERPEKTGASHSQNWYFYIGFCYKNCIVSGYMYYWGHHFIYCNSFPGRLKWSRILKIDGLRAWLLISSNKTEVVDLKMTVESKLKL